jgi:EmrB/QacA subfamily drug resistance transporter
MKTPKWSILVTLALGTLLVGLDKTVVNLAIPRMIADFHTTVATIGWVSTAYLLTNSIFIPVFGKLSDIYGPRRVYVWGFSIFTVVSVITGFSWSIGSMIFFRALQGLFGASVYPTAMALIAKSFEKEARAEALGIWTSIIAGSVVIGPLIGGPLIDAFSWPAAFFVNAPIGILALFMAMRYLPKHEHESIRKPFDYKGATFFSLMLIGILLVLERGVEWGWTSPLVIIIAVVSLFFLYFFISSERKTDHPFIPLRLLKNEVLASILFVSLIIYGTLFGFMFLFSLYAQNVLHLNATENGLYLLPLLIAVSVVSPFGGKLVKRHHPHVPVILGLILSSVGMGILYYFYTWPNHVLILCALGLIGAGIGVTSAPLSTTTTTAVRADSVGMASSLLNLIRNIAGVFFIAILTILLSFNISYQILFGVCAIAMFCTFIPAFILRKAVI